MFMLWLVLLTSATVWCDRGSYVCACGQPCSRGVARDAPALRPTAADRMAHPRATTTRARGPRVIYTRPRLHLHRHQSRGQRGSSYGTLKM